MKHTRFAVYAAAAIVLLFALLTVSGCGGGSGALSSTVTTPWNGYMDGVATQPSDGETNIATSRIDSWIHVYWPDANFPPPPRFTVSVEKEETPGNWGGVHTRLSISQSDPNGGSWWFQPDSDFSPYTSYRIVIEASGETTVIHYFETGGTLSMSSSLSTRSASAPKAHRPAKPGDADGEDSVVHTINRAK
jgi:hypothetical protein